MQRITIALIATLALAFGTPAMALDRVVDPAYTSTTPGWGTTAFDTISAAVAAAAADDVILLNSGTYSGASNKNITVSTRVSIRSASGAASTIIDLSGFPIGRAFVFASGATNSTLEGVTIRNGFVTQYYSDPYENGLGGAIRVDGVHLNVRDCVFENNEARYGGGAINTRSGGSLSVLRSRFSNNEGGGGGGALDLGGGTNAIDSSVFEGNQATTLNDGGAISASGATTVRSCLFSNNFADGDGGAVFYRDDTGSVANSTFVNNVATDGGGMAIEASSGITVAVTNSIFWGNTASGVGAQIFADNGSYSGLSVPIDYSVVQGGAGGVAVTNGATATYGTDNLTSDPQFVSASDFHLGETSPARDSGTNSPPGGLSAEDADGESRVQNGTVDMGALEYPAAPLIELSSATFQFYGLEGDADPADQVLSVSNSGVGTLDWTLAETCPWLTLTPAAGDTTIETDAVTLQVDIIGLPAGPYPCDVTVSAPGAGNSPQTVTVDLTVGGLLVVPDAFTSLQNAVTAAVSGDHILLRDGTYSGVGNVDVVVQKRLTIRSENGPDATIIDCEGSGRGFSFLTSASRGSVLEGITIRNGNLTDNLDNGGAVLCEATTLTLRNCNFLQNQTAGSGGAVYSEDSELVVENCVFRGNQAAITGGLHAAGSTTVFQVLDSVFDTNVATLGGAGGAALGGDGTVRRCAFTANNTAYSGGGLYLGSGVVEVTDSLFAGNHADQGGGAVWVFAQDQAAARFVNCTVADNTVDAGGTGGGVSYEHNGAGASDLFFYNGILWGNTVDGAADQLQADTAGATLVVDYSDVAGGPAGIGAVNGAVLTYGADNLDSDPLFTSATIYTLQKTSPCRDAGSSDPGVLGTPLSATDLVGNPRVENAEADLGAYEYAQPTTPLIGLSQAHFVYITLEGDANPADRTLSVTNTGIDTLNWSISEACAWLEAVPAAGDTTVETDDVALGVDLAGLTRGQYSCSLTVADPAAANDPQAVTVDLSVGGTIRVPDDFATIQAAIDDAVDGDVVLVGDGTWTGPGNVDLDFGGRAITVRSENGPVATVIDGEGAARGFVFTNGETATSVVQGFTIRNGRVTGNGGAVHVGVLCSPTIADCVFENNTALVDPTDHEYPPLTGNGGAVYLGGISTSAISDCQFLDNVAYRNGGGIYLDGARPRISGTTFAGNTALYATSDGGRGGALYGHQADGAVVERTTFRSNHGIRAGGAVYLDSDNTPVGATTFRGCTFVDNESTDGGALANEGGLTIALNSCFFYANLARRDGGALFVTSDAGNSVPVNVTNCTFSANAADGDGGAIWNGPYTTLTVANSILWGDTAAGDGSEIYNESPAAAGDPGGARVVIGYTDLDGGLGSIVNVDQGSVELSGPILDEDPELVLADDPHLTPISPCIDAGTNTPAMGLPAEDLDGGARVLPAAGRVDLGASEYDAASAAPGVAVTPSVVDLTLASSGVGPVDVVLSLRNRGAGSLSWEVSADCGWITADPAAGVSTGELDQVEVTVDAASLAIGTHRCTVTVADSAGTAAAVEVPVTVRLTREFFVSAYLDPARDDFATIQEGIDAAADGDTVVVRAGTYTGAGNVALDYAGKAITVRSESGAAYTVIDCEGSARGFWFHNGEGPDSVLEGITIRNGSTAGDGGGILCEFASPTIRGCVLEANHADGSGGGLRISGAVRPVLVADTTFIDNDAGLSGGGVDGGYAELSITGATFRENRSAYGGAVSTLASEVTITHSVFEINTATTDGGAVYGAVNGSSTAELWLANCVFYANQATDGGGLYLISGAGSDTARYTSRITNCTFYANEANAVVGSGGGMVVRRNNTVQSEHTVSNCLFYANYAATGADVYAWNDPYLAMDNCLVTSAASNGNQGAYSTNTDELQGNPWFRSASAEDFRLQEYSPCVDAGRTVDGVYSDLRGSVRPLDGDDDGVSAFDIGAYEFSRYYSGEYDAVAQPFQDLELNGSTVVIGYEYKVLWQDLAPFPGSDPRVSDAGRYRVRLALVADGGGRVDLATATKELQLTGATYAMPVTFGPEHIGTWRLCLEMAEDPGQFVLSTESFTVEYLEVTDYAIGLEIPAPAEALAGMSPDIEIAGLCYWSQYDEKLYAVAPGVTLVTWYADEAKEYPNPVLVGNVWPTDPTIHVAATPPVELLPEGSAYNAVTLEYSGVNAALSGSAFQMPEETYSVLHLYHTDTHAERFLVVRSLAWDHVDLPDDPHDPVFPVEDTWNIGASITAPPEHEPGCGGGFVMELPAPYDGFGEDRAYDPDTRSGPIIPVNESATGADDDLVVTWYAQDADGVCWPAQPVRYDPRWPDAARDPLVPVDGDRPVTDPADMKTVVIETADGSGPLDEAVYGESQFLRVYHQPDPDQTGYNPNEEHALIETSATGADTVLYGLRNDLNRADTSQPYALLKYRDPGSGDWAIEVFKVTANVDTGTPGYVPFATSAVSGSVLQPPHPLPRLITTPCAGTAPTPMSGPTHRDKDDELYAREPISGAPAVVRFEYPLQVDFHYDRDGDGDQDVDAGTCIPWELVLDGDAAASAVEVRYDVNWPPESPALQVGETLLEAKDGLPDITNQCSVKLLFGDDRVRLVDPMGPYTAALGALPSDVDFEELPFYLSERVAYDEAAGELSFAGYYDDTMVGEPLLLPNLMSQGDRDALYALSTSVTYRGAVTTLYDAGRATLAAQTGQPELFVATSEAKALMAGAATATGNVLVAFNDNEACSGPVDLVSLDVQCPLYRGDIKVIEPADVFDNRVTLRHSGDFGGESDGVLFEWRWWEDADDRPGDPALWTAWFPNAPDGQGAAEIVVDGDGEMTLADKWFVVRYQKADAPCGSTWSEWTEPQLYQGWVKRVLSAINLFDQRFDDFHENEVNTLASMIMQAGERYEGAAALDYDNLDSLGLIEFYQTLLDRARELTIDASQPSWTEASNQQLLLAASRLADLYMLLGNEAYADAVDPTIGFSTDDGEYGSSASSMFSFQNQVASLLEEELVLLRGRDDPGVRPFYNRLIWNFTQTEGEVAYRQNYNIFDWNGDGAIDEYDARAYFPQGHGDAWGHYLSAFAVYYDLLRHPEYEWNPRAESLLVAGASVLVDYEDERRFARVAAAKARTGADVLELTLRQRYGQSPLAHLAGYPDTDPDRAWGVDDWASRAGQGAYFDWVVGNAVLPAQDNLHEGIEKVDRTTVAELRELPVQYTQIQATLDKAGRGLNPLGLAKNAVPFDFDPTFDEVGSGIQGETYFEQMYLRAVDALNNTVTVFDHANRNSELLRRQQDSVGDFQVAVDLEEQNYTNRLIEIFGYPYPDDCGPGGTYPAEYCDSGPDLYHYMYVDGTELTGMVPTSVPFTAEVDIMQMGVARFDAYQTFSAADGVWYPENPLYEWTPWVSHVSFEFPATDDAMGFMTRPEDWAGRRKAPGEIQAALSDLVQARADYVKATEEYDALIGEIEDNVKLIQTQWNVGASELEILDAEKDAIGNLDTLILLAHGLSVGFATIAEFSYDMADAIAEGIPDNITEVTGDPPAGLVKAAGSITKFLFNVVAGLGEMAELGAEQQKEMVSINANIAATKLENRFAMQQQLLELENLIRAEIPLRVEIFTLAEALDQARGQYEAAVAAGERLLEERYTFRTLTAADIQSYRYQDMAFRVFRNDALNKYRAQFDLAVLYTYLAAKAYDYETVLLDSDSLAGEAFFADIVRQRTVGQVEDGEPLIGGGLADVLKRLKLNYAVFKPQAGLNNPQYETNRFSLRSELFRLLADQGSDGKWRQVLESHRVDDLWLVPEFRRYCRPSAPEGTPQPGLVIPFDTTVTAGQNFFGWPLGGGDSYYSASNFATKVRSVGVWFTGYDGAGLAETPRVYLVPAGTDFLRSPSGGLGEIRAWEVVDQKIPTPFPFVAAELEGNDTWQPLVDGLAGELYEIRRHSEFRAYPDSGWIDESEMIFDSRLVGRSVWNNRWLLIIPGQNLLYDPDEALDRFIGGPEGLFADGERTGDGVTDIKLYFYTYANSGN